MSELQCTGHIKLPIQTHTHTHMLLYMAGCGCDNISNLEEDNQGDDHNYPVGDVVTTSQEKVIISTSAATG